MKFAKPKILSCGAFLPEQKFSNQELIDAYGIDSNSEWIVRRTGIHSRHVAAVDDSVVDFGAAAARTALANADCSPDQVDLIVFATTVAERVYPSSACLLQAQLGNKRAVAFDITAACSGFVYALSIAAAMMQSMGYRRALVVGAEIYTDVLDWNDRTTCVLFGDGAGACLLGLDDSADAVYASHLQSDGEFADQLSVNAKIKGGKLIGDPYTRMNGSVIYKSAIEFMTRSCQMTLAEAGLQIADVDWLVLHQANARIIEQVRSRLGVAAEKNVVSVGHHGNTSAASIPLALNSRQADFAPGDLILLSAIGGGLTWGSVLIRW